MIYLPFTFKLFGQQWTVRTARPYEITDLGQCRPDDFEIIINPGQNNESLTHTLTHELVHAIEQKLHLNLTEDQVDLFALGLIDLIRNNNEILDYIISEENENV